MSTSRLTESQFIRRSKDIVCGRVLKKWPTSLRRGHVESTTPKVRNLVSGRYLLLVCSLMTAACDHRPREIVGHAVTEGGEPIAGVRVKACYLGWGRSEGRLVWDKNYCSDSVISGHDGRYRIYFRAPEATKLWASAEGWVQAADAFIWQERVVLIKEGVWQARVRARQAQRRTDFDERRPQESASEYYCRVVASRQSAVNVTLTSGKIAIVPALLFESSTSPVARLAIAGTDSAVREAMSQLQLKVENGAEISANMRLDTARTCSSWRFILIDGHLEAGVDYQILLQERRALLPLTAWETPAAGNAGDKLQSRSP